MKILVTEIQTFASGQIATPSYAYDNRQSAEAKYHAILSAAAVSALPMHACMMFNADGSPIKHEVFRHEVQPETDTEG